jgi:hypothetical protein
MGLLYGSATVRARRGWPGGLPSAARRPGAAPRPRAGRVPAPVEAEAGGSAILRTILLANFILFQVGWFACVLGGAHGTPWLGAGVALAIVAWHVGRAVRPRDEGILLLIAAGVGGAADTALVATGWVQYASGTLVAGTAPYWLVAMWMLFATTLNVSLRWLRRFPLAAVALGAIGGPLAYWAGARLGAMQFLVPVAATVALAAGWAVLTPLLVGLARRFDGYAAAAVAGAETPPPDA